jgi:glutaredoxin 3
MFDPEQRRTMIEKSGGRRTVPQIFIDGQHIGGFEDLSALDANGELDRLLSNKPSTQP